MNKNSKFDKYYDVIYLTKSGRGMIYKRVPGKNKTEVRAKVNKEMKASTSFDKIVLITEVGGLKAPVTKGLTTVCAMNVGVTGRRKKDGTQKKGYVAKKGGKLVKKSTKTRKVKL